MLLINQKICNVDLGMTRAAVYLPGAFGVTYSTLPITALAHLVLSPASSRSATSSLYTPLSVWQSTMSRCAACASAAASVVQAEIACASHAHYSLLVAVVEPCLCCWRASTASNLIRIYSFSAQLAAVYQSICTDTDCSVQSISYQCGTKLPDTKLH